MKREEWKEKRQLAGVVHRRTKSIQHCPFIVRQSSRARRELKRMINGEVRDRPNVKGIASWSGCAALRTTSWCGIADGLAHAARVVCERSGSDAGDETGAVLAPASKPFARRITHLACT